MAHTLSSQQFPSTSGSSSGNSTHSYQQCSPSSNSGHHAAYNNYHRSHPTVSVHGGFQHSGKLRLSEFRGKSWLSFGEALASESSDDDTDAETQEDPLAIPSSRRNRGSVVRLKRRDIPLFGYRPETDPFAVTTCRHCRKVLKSSALRRHIDMRHEPVVKLEKISEKYAHVDKISGAVEKISVATGGEAKSESSQKRHRHVSRKSTPPAVAVGGPQIEAAPPPPPPLPQAAPQQPQQPQQQQPPPPPPPPPLVTAALVQPQPPALQQPSESSSASNSPQPRRKKRKQVLEPLQHLPPVTTETFQTATAVSAPPPPPPATAPAPPQQQMISASTATPCRIIMSSSPPPLAPITNEAAPPSVWIVTPSPAVIIDGSFVVKPLEAEMDSEIDLKDLKVLKPAVKEAPPETSTSLTASNWYTSQPRPLALNTFNMRKINAQRYVMATQRKLIELQRTLRQDDKIASAVVKPQPKTWSFIERSQVFIPFRVTH